MKKVAVLLAFIVFGGLYAQNDFKKSEEQIKRLPHEKIAVGVAGGVLHDGKIVWTCSSGFSDVENQIRFTPTTLTRVASIAKPMTAIAVLQLYEQGLVDLEAPIQDYVSDFPVKEEGTITVRHLLNHSSGIAEYASKKEAHGADNYATLTEAMNVFKNRELLEKPGIEEFYTTYGYVVLGVLIERVSGMSYEAYMQKNIWDKAGMVNTGVEKVDVAYTNKSLLYDRNKNGKIKKVKGSSDLSNRVPGGGLYATVEDLLRFGQAVLDHTLISETSTALMLEEQAVKYDGNPYALGWFLYSQSGERKDVFGHGGSQKGCSAQIMLVPKRKAVVAILSNTSGGWGDVIGASVTLINDAGLYDDNDVVEK